MTGWTQARPYETGPDFDTAQALTTGQVYRSNEQKNRLGELGLELEQLKAQRAQENYQIQQNLLASMGPAQRLAFSFAPEQSGAQLAKKIWPENKQFAVSRVGVWDPDQNKMVYVVPGMGDEWGDEDTPQQPDAVPGQGSQSIHAPQSPTVGTPQPITPPNPVPPPIPPGKTSSLFGGSGSRSLLGSAGSDTVATYPGSYGYSPQQTGLSAGDDYGTQVASAAPPSLPQPPEIPGYIATGAPQDITANSIRRRETGGHPNPNTAKNPESSAAGADQFIDRTWLDQLTRNAPEVVEQTVGPNANLQDPAIRRKLLDLRSDGALSRRLTTSLAQENASALQGIGIKATPRNLIMAHFLGATGAARMLSANPDDLGIRNASEAAIEANSKTFFDPKTGRPRKVKEILAMADHMLASADQPEQTEQPGQSGQGAQGEWHGAKKPITKGAKAGYMWQRRRIGTKPNGDPDWEYRTVDSSGEAGSKGPFAGTSDGQYLNELVNGDPNSLQYALAYHQMTQPHYVTSQDPNDPSKVTTTYVTRNLPPNVRKPVYRLTPEQISQAQAEAQSRAAPGETAPAVPTTGEAVGTPTAEPVPGTSKGGGASAADRTKLKTAEVEMARVKAALAEYRTALRETGGPNISSWAHLPTNDATRLKTAYYNLALLLKGDALYQLGVLNGPDLTIIRETLLDPASTGALFSRPDVLTGQVDQVEKILDAGMAAARSQYGGAKPGDAGAFAGMTREQLMAVDPKTLDSAGKAAFLAALEALK
jgi:hypothetical protein